MSQGRGSQDDHLTVAVVKMMITYAALEDMSDTAQMRRTNAQHTVHPELLYSAYCLP